MHVFFNIYGDASAGLFSSDNSVAPIDVVAWYSGESVWSAGSQMCLGVTEYVRAAPVMLGSDVGELRQK